jgi:hypothetical protein
MTETLQSDFRRVFVKETGRNIDFSFLFELTERHKAFCLVATNDELTDRHYAVRDQIEEEIQHIVDGESAKTTFNHDPRGPTVRVEFNSGVLNSISGGWIVPVDDNKVASKAGTLDSICDAYPVSTLIKVYPGQIESSEMNQWYFSECLYCIAREIDKNGLDEAFAVRESGSDRDFAQVEFVTNGSSMSTWDREIPQGEMRILIDTRELPNSSVGDCRNLIVEELRNCAARILGNADLNRIEEPIEYDGDTITLHVACHPVPPEALKDFQRAREQADPDNPAP